MKNRNRPFIEKILSVFSRFEEIITISLAVIISLIIVIALLRIFQNFYNIFAKDFFSLEQITFEDYQQLFGKIMTLLISIEFMSSILKVLKTHEIKTLILDVILITALAIGRKLIIYDYEHHDPMETIVLGGLLISIGIFYFLIKYDRNNSNKINQNKDQ